MVLKIKRICIFIFINLFSAAACFAQDSPVVSKGALQFYIDYSSFSGKDNKTYTEFYLMLFSDQLETNTGISANEKELLIRTAIRDSSGTNIISEKKWNTNALLPRDSMNPKNMVVYDQWAELMSPGFYNINVKVSATDPDKEGEADFTIRVPRYKSDNLSLSQIEFVAEVQNANDNSPFVKGNQKIIPNPWRRYGALNSRLAFYYELYNLPAGGSVSGEYIIENNSGDTVKQLKNLRFNHSSENISVVHGIDVSKLSTGVYDLNVVLHDSIDNLSISQSRAFEVIQFDSGYTMQGLTEDEAEIEGGLIKYIGTPKEYDLYSSLDAAGKAQYVINFWSEKDPTPGTPENEFLQKIKERFSYAVKKFRWGNTPGWKSDRGRVLIRYGMPDEQDLRSAEAGSKNYEIWTYNQDKTFIFIFADLRSNGNYTLIHSTKEGEISDPNWMEYLK